MQVTPQIISLFATMNYHEAKDFVLFKLKKELRPTLYYHNFQHTLDVCNSAEMLAVMEKVDAEGRTLLLTAALFHDTGFFWQYENNEVLACDFARQTLPRFLYSQQQIEIVCQLIMATQLPHQPKNHLERIICDADLDYLGREDFFITALRLHREWSENSSRKLSFKDWYSGQLAFVKQHEYFTQAAANLRNYRKKINLFQIGELLELLDTSMNGKNISANSSSDMV